MSINSNERVVQLRAYRDLADRDGDAVHHWFDLTYASYLTLPRSVLQSLPSPLQRQLIGVLDAITAHLSPAVVPPAGVYRVQLIGPHGRFMQDPLADYQRGRRIITKDELIALADR